MDEDVRTILSKLELRSCDGVGQKLTKMIANMTDDRSRIRSRRRMSRRSSRRRSRSATSPRPTMTSSGRTSIGTSFSRMMSTRGRFSTRIRLRSIGRNSTDKVKTQDVTKIIEAAQQISDKPTPHDDSLSSGRTSIAVWVLCVVWVVCVFVFLCCFAFFSQFSSFSFLVPLLSSLFCLLFLFLVSLLFSPPNTMERTDQPNVECDLTDDVNRGEGSRQG